MPLDLTSDKSTLVQVMAWCRQATSHYLSQCWPRSLSPYGVTRPQWVKQMGLLFFLDSFIFSNIVHYKCNIEVQYFCVKLVQCVFSLHTAQWILMTWCFSTRAHFLFLASSVSFTLYSANHRAWYFSNLVYVYIWAYMSFKYELTLCKRKRVQIISCHSAGYGSMCFQLFRG